MRPPEEDMVVEAAFKKSASIIEQVGHFYDFDIGEDCMRIFIA
jgi:hypothetical protein